MCSSYFSFLFKSRIPYYEVRVILQKKILCTKYILLIFFRKIFMRLGGPEALDFYQSVQKANYHFAYVNSARNYIINRVENLFNDNQQAIMFANKKTFVIHDAEQDCSQALGSSDEKTNTVVSDFIQSTYPKQKYLKIVAKIVEKHNLVNDDLFFVSFTDIHLADFCSFINNKFDKKENVRLIKLCKFIQSQKIRFPNVCIKNSSAKKYLC